MSLPWERFGPQPEPVPEVVEPQGLPWDRYPTGNPPAVETVEPQQFPDLKDMSISDILKDAVDDARAAAKDQATSYARDTLDAVLHGNKVDHSKPIIVRRDTAGREIIVADAKNRSYRTLLQGLVIDVMAAVAAMLATLSHVDNASGWTWTIVGALFLKTIVQAVISYFMRLRVKPTITQRGVKMPTAPVPETLVRKHFLDTVYLE